MRKLAAEPDSELYDLTQEDTVSYAVVYGEFEYQAGSWDYPRRVICKIEKPHGQMIHMYTFVITNMDSSPKMLIRFYCKRGQMENFIKECKSGFDMEYASSSSQIVNALFYLLLAFGRRAVYNTSAGLLTLKESRVEDSGGSFCNFL